jgi:hypothetical protein
MPGFRNQGQLLRATLLTAAVLLGVQSDSRAAPGDDGSAVPQPIPNRFNFPLPAATIDGWMVAGNTTAIRAHAWDLWSGMTAPSGQTYRGQQLPVWETWFGFNEVFPAPAAQAAQGGANRVMAIAAQPHRVLRAFTLAS